MACPRASRHAPRLGVQPHPHQPGGATGPLHRGLLRAPQIRASQGPSPGPPAYSQGTPRGVGLGTLTNFSRSNFQNRFALPPKNFSGVIFETVLTAGHKIFPEQILDPFEFLEGHPIPRYPRYSRGPMPRCHRCYRYHLGHPISPRPDAPISRCRGARAHHPRPSVFAPARRGFLLGHYVARTIVIRIHAFPGHRRSQGSGDTHERWKKREYHEDH